MVLMYESGVPLRSGVGASPLALVGELDSAGVPELEARILLAERDRFAAELAEYLLQTEGHDVCVAFDPEQAERIQRATRCQIWWSSN